MEVSLTLKEFLISYLQALRNDFVISVEGDVIKRSGEVNENLKTGDIEIEAKTLIILAE